MLQNTAVCFSVDCENGYFESALVTTKLHFCIKRSRLEKQNNAFSRIGAKLWNEIPCSLRELPKASFKKKKNSKYTTEYF